MNMKFYRKLPIPMEIKELFPATENAKRIKTETAEAVKEIIDGRSNKLLLLIGPCSADNEDATLEYLYKLRGVYEKVKDKILIVPRIYTNKPRTTGEGYKGMLHQPNPNSSPDLLAGILATRKLHLRAITETDFGSADEMLYPENHRYLSDLLSYVTVGARSVENQQHRLTASGLDIPVGMKNPTGGDLRAMLNAIKAAEGSHIFSYRGWEVESMGNPYAHSILRGYLDKDGSCRPNYGKEYLYELLEGYTDMKLTNPAVIIDTNHSNSAKEYLMQPAIAKEVLRLKMSDPTLKPFIKGLMVESYLVDGSQPISDSEVYGKSITDPCLGFEKTERLIYDICDII